REEQRGQEEARREALRAELHGYGALTTEPALGAHCRAVEAVIVDKDLEDFLRTAGGLKIELQGLVQVRLL
ncbi:unnamed protein product, partial [Discosporangium mesarthrocarpum]